MERKLGLRQRRFFHKNCLFPRVSLIFPHGNDFYFRLHMVVFLLEVFQYGPPVYNAWRGLWFGRGLRSVKENMGMGSELANYIFH